MISYKCKLTLMCSIILSCATSFAGTFTVPDWLTDGTVFIMKADEASGTGYLFGVKDHNATFCYLVTAKHIIKPLLKDPNDEIAIRFNLKESNLAKTIKFLPPMFSGKRWLEHKNTAVDLAIISLPIFGDINELDVKMRIIEDQNDEFMATNDWLEKYKVGAGDKAFTLGLVPHLYTKNNENLVLSRFGEISLLPKNEINLPGGKQKAYFLDCQAFPGNSGGPAFVLIERSETGALIAGWRIGFLGTVTEFVPSPLRMEKVNLNDNKPSTAILLIENTGISKIVPVDYLIDILFSEQQKDFRKRTAEKIK